MTSRTMLLFVILYTIVLAKGTPVPADEIRNDVDGEFSEADRPGSEVIHEKKGDKTSDRVKALIKRSRIVNIETKDDEMISRTVERRSHKREKRADNAEVPAHELQLSEDQTHKEGPTTRGSRLKRAGNVLATVQEDNNKEQKAEPECDNKRVVMNCHVVPYISSFRGPFKVTPLQPAINVLKKTKKRCYCSFPCDRVHKFDVIGCEGPCGCPCGCGCPYPGCGIGCQSGYGGFNLLGGLGGFELGGCGSFGGLGSCGGCGSIGSCGGIGGIAGCGSISTCGNCGGCGSIGGCGGCGGFGGHGGVCECGSYGGYGVPTTVEHVYHCCKRNTRGRVLRRNTTRRTKQRKRQ